jgi:hypothetical protein
MTLKSFVSAEYSPEMLWINPAQVQVVQLAEAENETEICFGPADSVTVIGKLSTVVECLRYTNHDGVDADGVLY